MHAFLNETLNLKSNLCRLEIKFTLFFFLQIENMYRFRIGFNKYNAMEGKIHS